jgi:hypothetical protein
VIDGVSQTFDGIEFKSTDSTYITSYMFTVNSYAPSVTVTFKNCIIDVRGNFFMSNYPVKLIFDNCEFKVLNTVNLLTLDYSIDQKYGCTAGTELGGGGEVQIINSHFIDSLSTN